MSQITLNELQHVIQDKKAFVKIEEFPAVCRAFLQFTKKSKLVRIVSPSTKNYIFFQFPDEYGNKITRPINTDLFVESPAEFTRLTRAFGTFLDDLKRYEAKVVDRANCRAFIESGGISKFIYTIQQSVGSIGDSFGEANQTRKRVGDIFESFVRLIMQYLGLQCEPRTISLPVPNFPGYVMHYQLDLVFSRQKAILTSETAHIHPTEIVGSVKTTSKDRIDKLFLDKYLLRKLLGRDVPVVAIFLHDVQRAARKDSQFAINATFKTGHFLGYTVALTNLDGVYYVDPRPDMLTNPRLAKHIHKIEQFLTSDMWVLSGAKSP